MDNLMHLLGCRIDAYGGRFAQAHRRILDMFQRTSEICDATAARIGANPADASSVDLRDWNEAQRELSVLRPVLETLIEAYDLAPAKGG